MAKKIQLRIEEPCHEKWESMTPVQQGMFCGSCQKNVIDFSNMSDRQLAEFFKKPSTGSVCGRFMTEQLDRDIAIPRKRIPWIRYFFTIAIPAFFFSLKSAGSKTQGTIAVRKPVSDTSRKPIYAELKTLGMVSRPPSIKAFVKDSVPTPVQKPASCEGLLMGKPAFDQVKGKIKQVQPKVPETQFGLPSEVLEGRVGTVSVVQPDAQFIPGKVENESGEPVPFANISVHDKVIATADEMGRFQLDGKRIQSKTFLISAAGYQSQEFTPGLKKDTDGSALVQLKQLSDLPEVIVNSGMIVMGRLKRTTHCHREMIADTSFLPLSNEKEVSEEVKPAKRFRVFPNPVASGSTVTIGWQGGKNGYTELTVVNMNGQTLFRREYWIDGQANNFDLLLPNLPAGTYNILFYHRAEENRYSTKLIVQ